MEEVNEFYVPGLNNGVHFLYNSDVVEQAEATPTIMRKMKQQVDALKQAVSQEDALLKLSTKSLLTDEIAEADRRRVTLYTSIRKVVNSLLKVPEKAPAALKVKQGIKDYAIKISGQFDKKSGLFVNLINDLQTLYVKEISLLNLTGLVQDFAAANAEAIDLMKQRDKQRDNHVNGALPIARKATDKAYYAFVKTLNAHIVLEGDAGYADFVAYLNAVILRYQREVLHQRGKHNSSSDADAGDSAGGNDDGEEEPPQG
ncbi:MAG: DUF6261 family protein [Prevotellaceae bacterium]|jgi:hypothetical protein|nr:DUF6261 family protein [Prevotellaceae bacterium]